MAASGMHKGSCSHCQEHIEYPKDFEGSEVTCPHCGQPTLLKQETPAPAGGLDPPSMGGMGGGRSTARPPEQDPRGHSEPVEEDDPLAGAAPQDFSKTDTNSIGDDEDTGYDPFTCTFCGADMEPTENVCVECGSHRPLARKWDASKVFRVVALIILLGQLLILVLQWTTTSEPFGLRQRTRDAFLQTIGLKEKETPLPAAPATPQTPTGNGTDPSVSAVAAPTKDPDLRLTKHAIEPDKDNGALYIVGTIKNVSQYRYYKVRITFQLKDAAGSPLETPATAYTPVIEPGKEWPFKALIIDTDTKSYDPILPIEGSR
jgi:DNA-directed RNA polymerase subunit RPC12/RpoP